jgi:hypothetical protein
MFLQEDYRLFQERGITEEQILKQVQLLKEGTLFQRIVAPATLERGILKLTSDAIDHYKNLFEEQISYYQAIKFVPASGAATRMFKDLYAAIELLQVQKPLPEKIEQFFINLSKFAFYRDLKSVMTNPSLDEALDRKEYLPILESLLFEKGLHFGNKPKGLIPFHDYGTFSRTAFEEHLFEGLSYLWRDEDPVWFHFTVSPEHRFAFETLLKATAEKFGITQKVKVDFSIQHPATDTVAIYENGDIVRDEMGRIIFRPGGHGALLRNLNSIDADLIFIKNIDNVVPEWYLEETVLYKKVLGGYLMSLVEDIHANLVMLEDGNLLEEDLAEMVDFAQKKLFITFPEWFFHAEYIEKVDYLYNLFNRPIRVCGVVKNEGQPGGGPFFCENEEGLPVLQIVEQSQINMNDPEQRKIFESSTHFNPVDIVCYVRDFEGNKFDLEQFVDPRAGIITEKTYKGKPIKVLELPGLWNGSMADWITVFVEVPSTTFNPVKEVFDLLKPMHQPKHA